MVKERDPEDLPVLMNKIANKKDAYEIKRLYWPIKNNPWLTQTIRQANCLTDEPCGIQNKDENEIFKMNLRNSNAPLYYRQDPIVKSTISQKVKRGHSTKKKTLI